MQSPLLHNLYCSDVDDFWTWEPNSLAEVMICVGMDIGWPGKGGSDHFHVNVATPEALRAAARGRDFQFLRGYLLVWEYRRETIEKAITAIIEQCEAESWEEAVELLTKYFRWKYENIRKLEL